MSLRAAAAMDLLRPRCCQDAASTCAEVPRCLGRTVGCTYLHLKKFLRPWHSLAKIANRGRPEALVGLELLGVSACDSCFAGFSVTGTAGIRFIRCCRVLDYSVSVQFLEFLERCLARTAPNSRS